MENNLERYLSLTKKKSDIREKMAPLESSLKDINKEMDNIVESLPFSTKQFISQKLWDAFSGDRKERVLQARKELEERNSSVATSYTMEDLNRPFDPFNDDWRIVDMQETDDGKVEIEVSCRRREGSISGIYTFLDVYWTVPFDLNEIGG